MKFFHNFVLPLAVLSSSANKVSALKCGIKGVTKPCVGDTDPRYDDSVGYNFVEQNDFWKKYDGLHIIDHTQYDNNGTIIVSQPFDFAPQLGDYNFLPTRQYVNVTIVGSRLYSNSHLLYGNVDSNKPGIVSLLGTLLQQNDYMEDCYWIVPQSNFATSTFEKNGEARTLCSIVGFATSVELSNYEEVQTPVRDSSVYSLVKMRINDLATMIRNSILCLDDDCEKSSIQSETYNAETLELVSFTRSTQLKVSESKWKEEMAKSYEELNIRTAENALPGATLPFFLQPDLDAECATLACPTEDDWATQDPNLRTSPYIEPDGVIEGGFIAGVTIASLVVLITLFYFFHKNRMAAKERHLKEAFAKSIAKNIKGGKLKDLSPADLQGLYDSIDIDKNGYIAKDELKVLIEEGDAANLSENDFTALFSAIDIDDNGTVDFSEFCAFFVSLPSQTEENFKFEDNSGVAEA